MNRADRRALQRGKCRHDWQPENAYYPDVMVCVKCTAICDRADLPAARGVVGATTGGTNG